MAIRSPDRTSNPDVRPSIMCPRETSSNANVVKEVYASQTHLRLLRQRSDQPAPTEQSAVLRVDSPARYASGSRGSTPAGRSTARRREAATLVCTSRAWIFVHSAPKSTTTAE